MNKKNTPLSAEQIRWRCDVSRLKPSAKSVKESFPTILGQDRAVRAITTGLDMNYPGYNIYVSGDSGTGRNTTVNYLLEKHNVKGAAPPDICYVNNFTRPDMPTVLKFPAGEGCKFRKEMCAMIDRLGTSIPKVFESEKVQAQRDELIQQYGQKQKENVAAFEAKAKQSNFVIVQIQIGPYTRPDVLPLIGDQPVPLERLAEQVEEGRIAQEEVDKIIERQKELSAELVKIFKENQKLQRELEEKLVNLDQDIVNPLISDLLDHIRDRFAGDKVAAYLDSVLESLLANLDLFRDTQSTPEQTQEKNARRAEYEVNVLVDNSTRKNAPIVFENSPTFSKLFGTIERELDPRGRWRTDFTKIRSGSLLLANGGYLVLNAMDVLIEPGVWNTLKRVLKTRKTEIQSYEPLFMIATSAVKPEPIQVDVKVVMIGDPFLYRILFDADQDFKKIFKIKADFDSEMKNEKENQLKYAEFIRRMSRSEDILEFAPSGVGAVTEFGVRLAGRRNKLSTRFNQIADLLREASYLAKKKNAKRVEAEHVEQALEESIERHNLIEEKIQEMIEQGTIMIDTEGSEIGQVNGLSVISLGDYMFGRPSRITAQVAMGRQGIINIERESALSGPTHDKGVLILGGYLRGCFAQDKPLSISASICFEQSYSGVDGDSASSAEIYALLSQLSEAPIRQEIAVTGSVNQKGEIQPIGGVNEKIEGFFKVCKLKGLTGTQGVIIPRQNVEDLMLNSEVVSAVEQGRFHIYPVEKIEQGVEILTGKPAGERKPDGSYPASTLFAEVDARLELYATRLKSFSLLQ